MDRARPAHPTPTPASTPARRRSPLLGVVAALGLLAGAVASFATGASAQAASTVAATGALSSNWYASAPYLMPEDNT
ncbi:chitinase, partial [Kitasatospora sp. NPDC006697]